VWYYFRTTHVPSTVTGLRNMPSCYRETPATMELLVDKMTGAAAESNSNFQTSLVSLRCDVDFTGRIQFHTQHTRPHSSPGQKFSSLGLLKAGSTRTVTIVRQGGKREANSTRETTGNEKTHTHLGPRIAPRRPRPRSVCPYQSLPCFPLPPRRRFPAL